MTQSPLKAGRFHVERPTDLRTPNRWHRLSHIIEALPDGLAKLAPDLRVGSGDTLLDYGCADQPYRRLFPTTVEYVGADLPGNPQATVEIQPDGSLPLPDESVDAVLSTQVLEHVTDPGVYLTECFRVLRPHGRLLLSTHGIMVWHPDPVDLWRWTGEGLQREVESAGFRVLRIEGIMGLASTGLQLFQDAVYWKLPRPLKAPFTFTTQTLVRVLDNAQGPESKRMNALVFALIAEKS